ncbi:hypothetical protein ISF_02693 [Cordyceps fumosorosea ARSEF 2679]|uniref:Alpha N-terminal protein methyltransferase 1 n=1 Tax=Cordyceps fumosorosea (strain ARSEF 2679) TaxID=1081104 RepID=A0A162MUN4_CORFA|nr:hypothetical protein ISF_02693 [Cordyceps fumosorosea ARSEF 2679]OAA70719.1 hypothetical protein ISF_02693 [Cordyceps fumosorosea ARSEF 2679]
MSTSDGVRPDSLIRKTDGRRYWEAATADLDGMLGGIPAVFSPISRVDLQGSRTFLSRLGPPPRRSIGRVTEGLLSRVALQIDVVEPVAKFVEVLRRRPRVRRVFPVGLEDWSPAAGDGTRYDLVWMQWVLVHLTDEQVVGYLERCRDALVRGDDKAVIVVKENVSTSGRDEFDSVDSTVTRPG